MHYALRKLGIEKLRKEQDKVIRSFVGGKSLCFALLPYIIDNMMKKTGSIVIRVSDGPTEEVFTLWISDSVCWEAQQDQSE